MTVSPLPQSPESIPTARSASSVFSVNGFPAWSSACLRAHHHSRLTPPPAVLNGVVLTLSAGMKWRASPGSGESLDSTWVSFSWRKRTLLDCVMLTPERQTNSPGDGSLNKEMELFTDRPTWNLQGETEGAPETSFLPGPGMASLRTSPRRTGHGAGKPSSSEPEAQKPPTPPGRGGSRGETAFRRGLETAFSFGGSPSVKSGWFDKIETKHLFNSQKLS